MSFQPMQREVDSIWLEVCDLLAPEELGGRRRAVWYRNRNIRTPEHLILGKPGLPDRPWILITPTPSTFDVKRDQTVDSLGLIEIGAIEIRISRLSIAREILNDSEFYINDDPDAIGPSASTNANYNVIGGRFLEGGSGVKQLYHSFWVGYLRKLQATSHA